MAEEKKRYSSKAGDGEENVLVSTSPDRSSAMVHFLEPYYPIMCTERTYVSERNLVGLIQISRQEGNVLQKKMVPFMRVGMYMGYSHFVTIRRK